MISNIQQRIQKQWELAMNLQTMVGQIPKMNQDIEEVMKILGMSQNNFVVTNFSVSRIWKNWTCNGYLVIG
jgi:hypothetical protein